MTVQDWKKVTSKDIVTGILVFLIFVSWGIGYYMGISEGEKNLNEFSNFTDQIENIVLISSDVSNAIDTAKATAILIDEHAYIYSAVSGISKYNKEIFFERQKEFADRTIYLLDKAYEEVAKLAFNSADGKAKQSLLQSKIEELKELAVELRSIAYKQYVTEDDSSRAIAIANNMISIAKDISGLCRELIDITAKEYTR